MLQKNFVPTIVNEDRKGDSMSTHRHRTGGTSVPPTKPRGQQMGPGGRYWQWSKKQRDSELDQLPVALRKRLEEIIGHIADALAQPKPIYPQMDSYRAKSQHQAGIFITAGENHRKAAQHKIEVAFGIKGKHGSGPKVTLVIWGLNASALNSLFAKTGGDLNKLAEQVVEKCDLSVPIESVSAPAAAPIHLNGHGAERRDEGVSLAAAGPSVVLETSTSSPPTCHNGQAAIELRPDGPASAMQEAMIRILATGHGIFNGRDFGHDELAFELEDACPPITNAGTIIDKMIAWGHLASDESRLHITPQGYEFCFGGPSVASN